MNSISYAVTDMAKKLLGKRMDKHFDASTMILVSFKPAMMPGIEYANAACVLENILLAATSMGIHNIIGGYGAAVVGQSEEMKKRLLQKSTSYHCDNSWIFIAFSSER